MTADEFEAVYERTVRPLRAYLARSAGDLALADDLLQETYYRFLRLSHAQRTAAPERPLLFRIASHALHDHFRRFRRDERLRRAAPAPSEAGVDPAHEAPDVARAFAELPLYERTLLWLAHVEGLSHAEVAEALTLRPGSVRVLLYRARQRLARILRAKGLDPGASGGG